MAAKFYQSIESGSLFNSLIEDEAGVWMISYERPAAPFFVSWRLMEAQYERAQTPQQYEEYANKTIYNKAQSRRLSLISRLLSDERCIKDKSLRKRKVREASVEHGVTEKAVYRVYYRYLATRILTAKKKRELAARPDFDWAIRTFYFSSKRMSLRAAYETMLLAKYVDSNGDLIGNYPSWRSFERYYYSRGYNRDPAKLVAREGRSKYQRDFRPLSGSVMGWKAAVGSYQMDATQADIRTSKSRAASYANAFRLDKLTTEGTVMFPDVDMILDTTRSPVWSRAYLNPKKAGIKRRKKEYEQKIPVGSMGF